MLPAADKAARDLLAKALHLKALCEAATDGSIPFGVARAKRDVFTAAEKLDAELRKPFVAAPYGWRHQGDPT